MICFKDAYSCWLKP